MQAAQGAQQRGLPRAVAAHHRNDLPCRDLEAHVAKHGCVPVSCDQVRTAKERLPKYRAARRRIAELGSGRRATRIPYREWTVAPAERAGETNDGRTYPRDVH